MSEIDPTRTASGSGLFVPGEARPGLLLAWAPRGASPTDRARVTEELRVGRGEGADWVVDDDRVSGLHFRVRRFGDALLVQDAGSRNGTFVNGQPLEEPRAVPWGTVIRAGRCVFVTHADLGELDAPSPSGRELVGPFFAARMLRDLEVASRTGRHVLLAGPTGTGKELCARWLAARIAGPFVAHNCARSTSAEEAGSTLFGVGRAVFSGVEARAGLLEEAEGGVLFLDEVHTLPPRVQQSLLRFAEDGQHARIGATTGRALQVRLVFATNRPITEDAGDSGLAPDLVARLFVVTIPALAERRADVPAIFLHALERAAAKAGTAPAPLAAELGADHFEALCLEDWTDKNVRGLESLAAELVAADAAAGGAPRETVRSVFAARLRPAARTKPVAADAAGSGSLYERNRERIVAAWQASDGNLTRTEQTLRAEGLAVNRRWLAEFLRRWGIRP